MMGWTSKTKRTNRFAANPFHCSMFGQEFKLYTKLSISFKSDSGYCQSTLSNKYSALSISLLHNEIKSPLVYIELRSGTPLLLYPYSGTGQDALRAPEFVKTLI